MAVLLELYSHHFPLRPHWTGLASRMKPFCKFLLLKIDNPRHCDSAIGGRINPVKKLEIPRDLVRGREDVWFAGVW